ncbi:enoyl-CoA hydratase/isomerase family protein [Sneathiella chinensis]|uniref:Enoyl-CoA hydratase n=1 Tax=Sneathiella chinensis TaxID=349750 RepID=A0ABQ5U0J6_9PROT|nr:enoyl-CoA hydratase-related protein [Sneathiella chinensis]GLQ04857.1 enoyl-CoA hydratase [Sneathiella chinensis]
MSETPLTLEGLTFTTIELAEQDHILTITLNRPDRKNAINPVMSNELIYALDYAAETRSIRAVILAANGDVFCAGGDLRSMSGNGESGPVSNVPKRGETDDISLRIRHLNKPVIARIQGPVLAGALLLVCNATHAYAADHATFSAPEIKRGIWPFMVMASLFRVMNKRRGLDFIMRGNALSAQEAEQAGLINKSVPISDLDSAVDAIARDLAALAPGTMQQGLAAFNAQEDMDFDAALPYLREQLDICLKSADAREGITAFLEKRAPNWD